jgi:hypothetical protein
VVRLVYGWLNLCELDRFAGISLVIVGLIFLVLFAVTYAIIGLAFRRLGRVALAALELTLCGAMQASVLT